MRALRRSMSIVAFTPALPKPTTLQILADVRRPLMVLQTMRRDEGPRPTEIDIRKAVEAIVSERFVDGEISAVDITYDEDTDGSDVISVRLVFTGERLDPKKMLAMGSALRRSFADLAETAFPLVSFVSKSEPGFSL